MTSACACFVFPFSGGGEQRRALMEFLPTRGREGCGALRLATASAKLGRMWRTVLLYAIPIALMIAGWTAIHYLDQPYRSPTYRRSMLQCLGYAAWTTPMEGAGPLVILTVIAFHALPNPEMIFSFPGSP